MSRKRLVILLLVICLTQSGCALLNLPGEMLGGLLGLGSQALGVASSLPMPPPWVFF
ncbi:MAG: hypothetical protein KGJ09_08835 [Candidatus Omnitrophica bacterium]|nr:hypothetical protein [Candidatus Omnitrophota bacterium]MDE2010164.1 hypothetical protein [Candidatus Omnitrophota bacterium]MDE2214898.1 hypothetical protein [Candidatus Omnitrophota bacterium]MDE2230772.1 hypothetical protein [Candidatus Omnitrophota bacterium]